jgi:16S rRNA processing protein RimM
VRLVVARVGRPHGLRGEVTVRLHTDDPASRFAPGATVFAGDRALTVASARDHNGTLLLGFDQVADRSAAEALRGALLEAEVTDETTAQAAESAESPDDDGWYHHELVGLRAVDPAGGVLGTVAAVVHLPAQDLLEITRPDGARRLVPFVTAIVPTVEVDAGYLVIDAPAGLLDDDEGSGS